MKFVGFKRKNKMQDIENIYVMLAYRIQQAIDTDDLIDLKDCAAIVELKRIHFVETDKDANRKVISPITVYVSKHGSIDVMRFLLEEGADINAQDSYGNTPLLIAVENNRIEMIRFLLKQPNICPEIQNYYGETINSVALMNKEQVVIDCLKELEKKIICGCDTVPFRASGSVLLQNGVRH